MPIGAAIPMPQSGMDAFLTGQKSMQDIFNSLAQNKYNQGMLGVHEQEAARQQKLLPALLQEYADKHDLNPFQRQLLQAQAQQALAGATKAQALANIYSGALEPTPLSTPNPVAANAPINNQAGVAQQGSPLPSTLPFTPITQIPMRPGMSPQTGQAPNPMAGEIRPSSMAPSGQQSPANQGQMQPQASVEQGGEPIVGNETEIAKGNPRMYGLDRLAGMPGFAKAETHITPEGIAYTRYPSGRTTVQRIGPSGFQRELSKGDAKIVNELDKESIEGRTMLTNLEDLGQLMTSPEFKEIRQIPILSQKELGYYKLNGTPAQQKAIGEFLPRIGQLVVDMAGKFKGSFRVGEQALIDKTKVTEKDPYWVAMGKLESFQVMEKLLNDRVSMMAGLMRRGVDPQKASIIADQATNGPQIRKMVQEKLGTLPEALNQASGMVTIINDKTGEEKRVTRDEANRIMRGQ